MVSKELMFADFLAWLTEKPAHVRAFALRLPPIKQTGEPQWYRIKDTGQKCLLKSYDEDTRSDEVTCTVFIPPEYVSDIMREKFPDSARDGYGVFRIGADDLEPWELHDAAN